MLAAEKVTHKQQGTLTADNISHETLGVSVAEEPSLEGFTPAIGVDVMKVSQPSECFSLLILYKIGHKNINNDS